MDFLICGRHAPACYREESIPVEHSRNPKKYLIGLFLMLMLLCAPDLLSAGVQAQAKSASYEELTGGEWIAKENGKRFRYRCENGKLFRKGWAKIDGHWYYFRRGYVLRGLRRIDGKYYLFRKSGGAGKTGRMLTGKHTVKGKVCYFRTSGKVGEKGSRCTSEWHDVDGKVYYFNEEGELNPNVVSDKKFIKVVGKLARADMKRSGILASVTIAQAILESYYGKSLLGLEANNLFGMKASLSGNNWKSDWDGSVYRKKTLEYLGGRYVTITADFRAYDSYEDSIRDHSNYLRYAMNGSTLRYKGVKNNKSYVNTIQIIRNGGYATDPSYVSKICSLIKKYKLTKYDK